MSEYCINCETTAKELDRLRALCGELVGALNKAFVSLNFESSDPKIKSIRKETIEALTRAQSVLGGKAQDVGTR